MILHDTAVPGNAANTKAWFGICMLRYRHYSLRWIHAGTDFLVTIVKPILFAKYWQWPGKQSPNRVLSLLFGDTKL